MSSKAILCAGVLLLLPAAAAAATLNVIGSTPEAIACFRAADLEVADPDALAFCDRALADDDLKYRDRIATLVNRGIVRFRLQQLDGAVADFDAVLAVERNQPDALINKAIAMLANDGEIDQALAMLDRGLAGTPQRPWVGYYGRAVAHELAGRDALAYRDYRKARELKPGWALAERALSRFSRG